MRPTYRRSPTTGIPANQVIPTHDQQSQFNYCSNCPYYLQNKAALDAAGPVSIVDGAAHIAAHLDELNADPHVTSISFSGPLGANGTPLTLTLAQALNDTHALAAFTSTVCIAATSSAGGIEALTASQIAQLSLSGVTQLVATDQGVALTAAQKMALGAVMLAIVQPYSGGSEEVIRYQSSGLLASVSYRGIVGQPYTYYTISYGVTGASYASDTIYYGSDGRPESATYNNGMTSTWTYADDGARVVAYQGMSGSAGYTSHASVIDASGQTVADAEDMNEGSGILRLFGSNLTISSSASGLNVTTGADSFDVNPHANETIAVKHANEETFDFSSGFGDASISGLQAGGAGSDVIQFDLSMFSGLSSTNTASQNLAALLASGAAMQSGNNVTIADLAGDVLTLKDVTTTMLSASANSSFKFV